MTQPPQWVPPPPPQWGSPPPQGGSPQRGPSRRTLWLVIAGLGALILAIVVFAGLSQTSSPSSSQSNSAGRNQPAALNPGKNQPAPPNPGTNRPPGAGPSYQSGRSSSYQNGYEWGNQHMNAVTADLNFGAEVECNQEAVNSFHVARRDMQDWVQGCVNGLADQKAEPGPPLPTVQLPPWLECVSGDESKC